MSVHIAGTETEKGGVVTKLSGDLTAAGPATLSMAPKHIATCLDSQLGTLTNKGIKTVGGQQVVVLEDAGDKPGTAPGQLLIAADGPTLPVREIQAAPKGAISLESLAGGGNTTDV
ncbi:hypothetical protein [Baekduia alba]|uniref:hypothetical protein n=1 Tax=Baekduia alba TaxID=2997333 RepID=UPI0023405F8F|nr:hypothetical protein [Baekduia alba]